MALQAHPTLSDPGRVLEELRRLTVESLGSLPGLVYTGVEEALRLSVALAPLDAQINPYEDQASLWVLRQHHATHVMRFRQKLAQNFDRLLAPSLRDTPLELVSETQLETQLAAAGGAELIEHRNKVVLDELDARFAAFARALGRPEQNSNPIAPVALVEALLSVFVDEQVPATLRDAILRQYELVLQPVLPELYAKASVTLAAAGFGDGVGPFAGGPQRLGELFDTVAPRAAIPGLDTVAPRQPASPASGGYGAPPGYGAPAGHAPPPSAYPPAAYAAPAAAPPTPGAYDAPTPEFHVAPPAYAPPVLDSVTAHEVHELRELLRVWRQSAAHPPAATARGPLAQQPPQPAAPRELRVDEMVRIASMLQGEPADTFSRALVGPGRLAGAMRDELRDGTRRLGLSPDLMRFSPVEDDSIDLVALMFDSLFQAHPMIDRARRVYGRLVLPTLKVALADPSLFVRAEHPARKLLEAVTEACAGNNGETSQERELLDRAAAAAQRVVAEYNEDVAVFDMARTELDSLLAQQRRRIELQEERAAKATLGRERLQRAREQADAIVSRRVAAPPVSREVGEFLTHAWRHQLVQAFLREGGASEEAVRLGDGLVAADRAAAAGRGRELADKLLGLEPQILGALSSSGLDDTAARHALAVLVKSLIDPEVPRDLHSVQTEDNPEEREELVQWLGEQDVVREAPADAVERMASVAVNEWVQMRDLRGGEMAAKLAWISPLTERRLFVNRRGVRVLALTVAQMARLHDEGRMEIVRESAAVEQAMQQVRSTLEAAASTRLH